GPDDVVGHGAVQLHVLAAAEEVPAAEGEAQETDVHDGGAAGADDPAGRRHADQLATLQRLDGVAENLGVAEAVLVAQDDDRLGPGRVDAAVLRIAGAAAARDRDGVDWLRERGEQVVGRRAAAVFADVNDESILTRPGGIQLLFELVEA